MNRNAIDYNRQVDTSSVIYDNAPWTEKVLRNFKDPFNVYLALGLLPVAMFFMPSGFELWLAMAIYIPFFSVRAIKNWGLPGAVPASANYWDPNVLNANETKGAIGTGIAFMGTEVKTKRQYWLTDIMLRTHSLILGTTGSGKTELLISLATNALIHDSGMIYIDGKADSSLYAKLWTLARLFRRDDDILVINFQTGAEDVFGPQSRKRSNTLNPYAFGSSSMLSQMTAGVVQAEDAKSDMWSDRALAFVEALMPPLTYMRDEFGMELDVNVVREHFEMNAVEDLCWNGVKKYCKTDEQRKIMERILGGLVNYLHNIPGYSKANMGKHETDVLQQHGFITMQLIRAFSSLADTYGYIMRTPFPEIDYRDVFLNRRILVVLLPSLEKSPQELTNLGKINVASVKATMAYGLGSHIEGDFKRTFDSKQSESKSPFIMIFDEYGYYAVKGFAVVPAQVRSIGCSANFAGQDLPAFQKASKEEAESTTANTTTQFCGKLQCPITFEFFNKIAAQAYFVKHTGFDAHVGMTGSLKYMDNHRTSIERMDRISMDVLAAQTSGDWHVFREGKIHRIRSFYANPLGVEGKPKYVRVNHFVAAAPPADSEVLSYGLLEHKIKRGVEFGFDDVVIHDGNDELGAQLVKIAEVERATSAPGMLNRGMVAIGATSAMNAEMLSQILSDMQQSHEERDAPVSDLNSGIFSGDFSIGDPTDPEAEKALMLARNNRANRRRARAETEGKGVMDIFGELVVGNDGEAVREGGLLDEDDTFDAIVMTESMMGATNEEAVETADSLLDTLADSTEYPSATLDIDREAALEEFVSMANAMSSLLDDGLYDETPAAKDVGDQDEPT